MFERSLNPVLMRPGDHSQKSENINHLLKGLKHRLAKLFVRNSAAVQFFRLHEKFRVTEGPTPKGQVLWLDRD